MCSSQIDSTYAPPPLNRPNAWVDLAQILHAGPSGVSIKGHLGDFLILHWEPRYGPQLWISIVGPSWPKNLNISAPSAKLENTFGAP